MGDDPKQELKAEAKQELETGLKSVARDLFKELTWDMTKQFFAVLIWSSLIAPVHAMYSYLSSKEGKKCEYSSMWHYHPLRIATCKVMEKLAEFSNNPPS